MLKRIERHSYKGNHIVGTRIVIFEPYSYSDINLVMSLLKLKLTPDLLSRKKLMYRQDTLTNKYYGHCYHSTQALYYLMDTDQLVPMKGKDYRGETHWWLQDDDKIYDVTADQYYSLYNYVSLFFLAFLFSSTLFRNSSSGVNTTGPSAILSSNSSNNGSFSFMNLFVMILYCMIISQLCQDICII